MDKITASKLADLLNEGFIGEITFSGVFFARMLSLEFGINGTDFYEGKGDFVLSSLSSL